MDIAIKGTETARSVFRGSLSSTDRVKFDAMRERMVGDLERLTAYEAFTGFTFLQLTKIYGDAFYPPVWAAPIGTPIEVWVPLSQKLQEIRIAEPAAESGYILITMPPPMGGLPHLTALWNRILDDATDNLMPSLRLAKYLDQVDLVISDTAATLNFDTLNATLLAERTSNPVEGIAVLFDLYRFYGAQFDAIGWNGGTQVRALISAGAGDSSIRAGITNAGFNFVSGSAALTDGADAYSGTVAADSVNSGVGNDIVVAGSGADTISGGVGNDLLFGDAGNDLVMGEDGNDSMDGGADLDDLRGGRGSDTLLGGAGNDTLYGFTTYNVGAQGTGNSDTYDGGAGDDQLYDYEISDGDVYRLNLGGGADTVRDDGGVADRIDIGAGIATTATKVRNVDGNLIVSLSSGERLTVNGAYDGEGNASSNAIEEIRFAAGTSWDAAAIRTQASTGSALADRMDGFGGNDTMTGAAGNDTVLGAAGNDSIDGGADLDDLRGGRGSDTLLGGAGNDTLYGFTDYNVGAQGAGNSDSYDGGAGDDLLYDFETSDGDVYRLNLGGGADSVLDQGGAADRIDIGAGIATTATKVRNVDGNLVVSLGSGERLTVNGAYDGEGNASSNAIEEIRFAAGTSWDAAAIRTQASTGSAAADVLQAFSTADSILAGDGNDVVWARAGDDTINGGLGTDTMYGGLGNDTYLVDAATDVVTESLNEGTDTVQSSVSLTLGANVENLTLTGTGTLNGTGNTLANVLTGNASANALIGDAGNDTLNGGAGNDVLTGGTGADTYLFGAGSGIDTVQENDGSAGVVDVVSLAGSLTQANLQFAKVGNNLEMLITGSADKMVFKDWYLGSAYHVEQFRFSNATVLTDTQAQGMVSAMAAFSAPAAAVTTTGQLGQTAWMQPAIAVSGVA